MLKILLKFLPIIVPIIIFIIWYLIQKIRKKKPIELNQTLFMLMFFSSIIVFIFIVVGMRIYSQEDIDGQYVPPKMIDGDLIPGHFEEK